MRGDWLDVVLVVLVALSAFSGYRQGFVVGVLSWLLAARAPYTPSTADAVVPSEPIDRRAVFATIALSGACALGGEVVWTRLLATLMGATVYTFSIILAVFLIGLGIGSTAASTVVRDPAQSRRALGWAQLLSAFGIAWTAYMLADSLPYWPVNPLLAKSPWFNFQVDLARQGDVAMIRPPVLPLHPFVRAQIAPAIRRANIARRPLAPWRRGSQRQRRLLALCQKQRPALKIVHPGAIAAAMISQVGRQQNIEVIIAQRAL